MAPGTRGRGAGIGLGREVHQPQADLDRLRRRLARIQLEHGSRDVSPRAQLGEAGRGDRQARPVVHGRVDELGVELAADVDRHASVRQAAVLGHRGLQGGCRHRQAHRHLGPGPSHHPRQLGGRAGIAGAVGFHWQPQAQIAAREHAVVVGGAGLGVRMRRIGHRRAIAVGLAVGHHQEVVQQLHVPVRHLQAERLPQREPAAEDAGHGQLVLVDTQAVLAQVARGGLRLGIGHQHAQGVGQQLPHRFTVPQPAEPAAGTRWRAGAGGIAVDLGGRADGQALRKGRADVDRSADRPTRGAA